MSSNDGSTSTRHSNNATTNSKGNGNKENSTEDITPTWDELKRTPLQLARQNSTKNTNVRETHGHKYCITDMMHKSTKDLVSGRLQKPIVGYMCCMEYMTEEMSKTILKARKKDGDLWADKWYGEWTQRWQMVTLIGQQNIKRYLRSNGSTQEVAKDLFAGDVEEQKRHLSIIPMDRVISIWKSIALQYPEKVLQPAVKSVTKYKDSWSDGSQAKWGGWYRDSVLNLGAAKMASRIGSAFAELWNSIDDNDK